MKYLMILMVGVCLLFAAVPAVADQAADEAAIKKANDRRLAAWHAKDVKVYLSYFTKDCTSNFAGGPCGGGLVRESGKFPETWKNAKIEILKKGDVSFVTSDVAVLRYTSESSGFVDADGKPEPTGKDQIVGVYVKKEGKWLVAVHRLIRPIEE